MAQWCGWMWLGMVPLSFSLRSKCAGQQCGLLHFTVRGSGSSMRCGSTSAVAARVLSSGICQYTRQAISGVLDVGRHLPEGARDQLI